MVLERLHRGMVNGGALILSEKIALPGASEQALFEHLHHEFKHAMGYSRLEIAQKRNALENVLIPETELNHQQRLHECGFSAVETWFKHFNFCSFMAIK